MYKAIYCKGLVSYEAGIKMQQQAYEKVSSGAYDGILFILEHVPVYTLGTGGGKDNFLIPQNELEKKGIDIIETKRGGNVTFHGPGQIVAYPIFSLAKLKKDAHWYIDCLEEVVIKTIKEYGISGSRKPQYRGVWVGDCKISAVGVYLRRWIALHGLSLNISVERKYFNLINPCGITEYGISNLKDYIETVEINKTKEQMLYNFEKVFNIDFSKEDIDIL